MASPRLEASDRVLVDSCVRSVGVGPCPPPFLSEVSGRGKESLKKNFSDGRIRGAGALRGAGPAGIPMAPFLGWLYSTEYRLRVIQARA